MMNFNQLRAFHEVAKTLNFSAAARNLHVSQPAVTAHVRALEDTLGVKLFRKRGRRVVLSETGALLLRDTREVFELEKKMERTIDEVRHLERGMLKIGTTKTYARHLMPPLMTRFHSTFPNVRMILDEGSSLDMCRSLLELRNELAVVARVGECHGITFVPFRREEIAVFASATHPLTKRDGICFRELADQPVIMREEGSGIQDLILRCFESRDLAPNVLVETSNVEFIREMVERGDAVSFLVRSAMTEDLKRGGIREIPIIDEDLTLEVNIAYLDDPHLSPAAVAFLSILLGERADRPECPAGADKPAGTPTT